MPRAGFDPTTHRSHEKCSNHWATEGRGFEPLSGHLFFFSSIFSVFRRHIRVDLSDDEHLVRSMPCYVQYMIDYCSYTHNLRSCEIKVGIQTHDLCSALPTELSSHLGAGHWHCEFVIYLYMTKNTSEYMKDHISELREKCKFHNRFRWVYNCDDQSCIHIFLRRSNIWSYIFTLIKSGNIYLSVKLFVPGIIGNYPILSGISTDTELWNCMLPSYGKVVFVLSSI